MTILRAPVVYAPPLPDFAEVSPRRLGPDVAQEISLPIADQTEIDQTTKGQGKFLQGTRLGGQLVSLNGPYENIEHHLYTIHKLNYNYFDIDFAQEVRAWILTSDTDVFWDNWKIYFHDQSLWFNLGSGTYFMFNWPFKRALIKRGADNYTTRFDWYGIY